MDAGRHATVGQTEGKACASCDEPKPFGDFHRDSTYADGRKRTCKGCHNAARRAAYRADLEEGRRKKREAARRAYWSDPEKARARNNDYNARNPEAARASARAYYQRNPEPYRLRALERIARDPEAHRRYQRTRYWADPDAARRRSRVSRERHREQVKAYERAHREERRMYTRARRARLRAAEGSYTLQEWLELCEQYESCCLACGRDEALSVDHVVPLAKGGRNDITNIQPLCLPCNRRKGVRVIDYRPGAVS